MAKLCFQDSSLVVVRMARALIVICSLKKETESLGDSSLSSLQYADVLALVTRSSPTKEEGVTTAGSVCVGG